MGYTESDGHVEGVSWGHHEELYFSFGSTQTLITKSPEMMQGFLDAGGYLGGYEVADSEALLILQADRALLQGGANTSIEIAMGLVETAAIYALLISGALVWVGYSING